MKNTTVASTQKNSPPISFRFEHDKGIRLEVTRKPQRSEEEIIADLQKEPEKFGRSLSETKTAKKA
jgi:hypothetical protein